MVGVVLPPITAHHRQLGDSGDDGGYLVDSDGNAYPPYALSWRYLGVFLDDCNNNNNDDRRNRKLEENNNNNNNYSCRKVLWAAYHDPQYQGLGIAEYKFYQRESGKWDGRTCRAQQHWPFITRCQRLNCHEAHTKWELVGVFKQTDGLYDFTEQLFKHQGYCLWDADKDGSNSDSSDSEDGDNEESSSDYNFMTNLAENWVAECTQHESFVDANGNALYYDTKPLAAGFMTYGVYTDASCLTESDLTWSDILEASDNDNDNEGLPSIAALERWNALLGDYKICQPCRAYNRVITDEGGSGSGDGSEEEDSDDYEDGDDGEGGKDRSGFDCYDAAGYLNCNQCYKFQTQTDMEVASTADLESATMQGTILALQVEGITYGQGHYVAPGRALRVVKKTSTVFLSTLALVGVGYYYYNNFIKDRRRCGMENAADLKEKLHDDDDDDDDDDEPDGIFITKTRTRSARGAVTATDEFFEKKALEALVQEQDAQLSQQQQLIQRLQQRLDNYESHDTTTTTEGAAAQQRTTAVVKEDAADQDQAAAIVMEEAVEVNVEEETVEVKVKVDKEEEAVLEVNRKEEVMKIKASGSSGASSFSKTELGPATTSTSDDLKDYLDSLESSAPPTLPIGPPTLPIGSKDTPKHRGVYGHARTTLTKKSTPATLPESSGGIVGETVDVWSEFLGLRKTKYQIQAEHLDDEESSQVDNEIDEERCIRTIKTNSKKKKKSSMMKPK